MKNVYFERYAWPIPVFPDHQLDTEIELIIVIPCHNEPEISKALLSLNACGYDRPFLVIVVVNEDENEINPLITRQNQQTLLEVEKLRKELHCEILVSHQRLPSKKAGVGLARKIGMDEAARLFEKNEQDGIIVCFDADCICDKNYLRAISAYYRSGEIDCGVVFYEHQIQENKAAIIDYELHLRYYVDILRWAGFPYAFQTLGSCITVKSKRYQKEGGMNTRKAGEDFYFLHKVIPNGRFGEINTTTIYPASRISDRVPFGTGHAIEKYLRNEIAFSTYNPETFVDLKQFLDQIDSLFRGQIQNLPPSILAFLNESDFDENLRKIRNQSPTFEVFKKRFFARMDGFRILKFVHLSRDHFHPNVSIREAIDWLDTNYWKIGLTGNKVSQLKDIREHDKKSIFPIS